MKKMSIWLIAVVIFPLTSLFAQQNNSIWSLPPNYIQYSSIPPYFPSAPQLLPKPINGFWGANMPGDLNDGYDGQIPEYAHNAMQDKDGNLLFFIVDGRIFDNLGRNIARIETFPYPFYNTPLLSGANELVIIPDPTNCSKYYIFGDYTVTTPISNISQPQYIILDLSDPDLSYSPILYPQSLPGAFPYNAFNRNVHNKYAATKLRPDNSRLVFINSYKYLHVFKIDGNGLSFLHSLEPIPANPDFNSNAEILNNRAELEVLETTNTLNQLVYRVGYSYKTPTANWVVFNADVDYNSLNFVSGTEEYTLIPTYSDPTGYTFQGNIHGLEFSADGSKLFFTHETNALNQNPIEYHTIGSGNNNKQSLLVANSQDFQFTQIELGKNGEMLFVGEQNNVGNRIAKLSNPNSPSLSNWLDYSLTINYNFSIAGGFSNGNPSKKLYLLPDQIDGMNYAEHFTINTECCIANTTFTTGIDLNNNEHTTSGTWTTTSNPYGVSTITVKDELVIKTGANITANNLTFKFAPDAKLVIETGATFTVNNCTLTVETTCDAAPMWNGVDVMGPALQYQNSGQQSSAGKFIANNSLIEHAYWATHNFKTSTSSLSEEFGHRGGVIQATNTTFRNNHRAMVLFDFQNQNAIGNGIDDLSRFTNCIFVTDAPLNKPNLTPSVIMAHLFGVQGVNFYGCDFKNTATTIKIPYADRGLGIAADNCLLTVTSIQPVGSLTPDRSTFTDLLRGIEAYSTSSARTTKVTNTDFYNNWRSIYLKTNNFATILNNSFNVGENHPLWGASYGLFLDACNKYKVENNAFTTTHNGYLGVYVENSGVDNNEIYLNTFNNLTIGSQAAQINGAHGFFGGTGLEFRCNTYSNSKWIDIYVSSNLIKPTHGDCSTLVSPSNNQFSRTTSVGDFWQDNSVSSNVTYQYSQPNGYNIKPLQYNGSGASNNTFPTECTNSIFNPTTNCPVKSKKSLLLLKDELLAQKLVVNNLKEEIAQGNSPALFDAIENLPAGNVKNLLMAASPYLSDVVLLAYLQSNAPNGDLQQVLVANSPLTFQLLEKVQQMNLPKGIKSLVNNAPTGTPALQEIKEEIVYYENEVEKIKIDILRYFLFDEAVEERIKEAIEFLKQESINCVEKRCQLVEFYTINREYIKASQELSILLQNPENANFVKLYTNMIALEQTVNPTQELVTNTSIQQPIVEVAETPVRKQETAMAEVLLKRSNLRSYQETIEGLGIGGSGLRLINQEEEKQSSISNLQYAITVFPNPTSNEVNITHNLNFENGKVTFKVYNMLGVEVINENLPASNNEVKVNTLKAGVYFYTITQNNQTIKTDKLMVR